jgi:hypothetical protein
VRPLALLVLLPALALASPTAREDALTALRSAEDKVRAGERKGVIALAAQAMRRARAAKDHRLALEVARGGEVLARRLGDNRAADAYVKLAAEEADALGLPGAVPLRYELGELPPEPRMPPVPVVHPVREAPLGLYSHRSTIAEFRKRVKEDPEYLANLSRLKGFRDDPATTIVGSLEEPGVHVDAPRFLKDDYKLISKAYAYYKLVVKFGRTVDDEFGLAVLYVNMTFLKTEIHPVLGIVYGLTKTAAIVEATNRIIDFSVTGMRMDLAILALSKSIIDVVRRYDRRDRSVPTNLTDEDEGDDEVEPDDDDQER